MLLARNTRALRWGGAVRHPSEARTPRVSWRRLGIWTLVVLGLLGLDWRFGWDAAAWAWSKHHEPTGDFAGLIMACRVYGQFVTLAVAVFLIARLTPQRRGDACALLITVIAVGLATSACKVSVRRVRPDQAHGQTRLTRFHGVWSDREQSFPSGHTAAAFALSACLETLYPAAWPVWTYLAAGCGLSRVWAAQHFVSDVIAGAWLGVWLGRWLFQSRPLRRLAETVGSGGSR